MEYLHRWCNNQPDIWANHLALIEFSHNMYESTAHGWSPFIVTQQYEPRIGIKLTAVLIVPVAEDLVSKVCKELMKKQV